MQSRFGWIAVVALLAFACAVRAPGLHAPRPNVLVLVTDDQRWDSLGCCGDQRLQTPSLDALASEGVRFANAFVTTSICAASRASILTGLYESRHGFTFGTPPLANEHVDTSYPAQLRRAGYRTGFVGKFGIAVEKGASQRMFDVFEPLAGPPLEQRAGESQATHRCDRATDRAISFLDSCDPEQPWCLSVSFQEPHAEDGDARQYVWPSAFDSLYDDVTFDEPATMKPEFFAALPQFLRESESRVRFRWRFDDEQKRQRMVRGYHRLIAAIDASVGRIQRALRERGMADNTVIVFTSDNGYFLGERGFADKWYAYEPSIRVPLIVLDPRDPPSLRGVVRNEIALNVDLAPTILELAGALPPTSCQGESLAPLLRGEAPKQWRTEFFYENRFAHPRIPKSEGLRDERYTYIRWIERSPIPEELYDHVADFDQVRDLSQSPEHATTLAAMRARCELAAARAAARPQ